MLNVIGAITLTLISAALAGTLIFAGFREPASRIRASIVAAMWFAVVTALAGFGVYSGSPQIGLPAFGLSVAFPLIAGIVAVTRSRGVRAVAHGISMPLLVGVNAGRVLGVLFLVLLAAGKLPPTFARSAGWGDIGVGVLALPVAWAIHRRVAGWGWIAGLWNLYGLADLITAVSLGIGSVAGSPLRFVFEPTSSAAVTTLPWALIPAFLVPIYLFTHLLVFAQLATGASAHAPRGVLREVPAR